MSPKKKNSGGCLGTSFVDTFCYLWPSKEPRCDISNPNKNVQGSFHGAGSWLLATLQAYFGGLRRHKTCVQGPLRMRDVSVERELGTEGREWQGKQGMLALISLQYHSLCKGAHGLNSWMGSYFGKMKRLREGGFGIFLGSTVYAQAFEPGCQAKIRAAEFGIKPNTGVYGL